MSETRSGSAMTRRVPRLLVIDDEPRVADAIRLVLADEFDVSVATNASDALLRLTSGDGYDVILCDVVMPGMDGVALRNRVHEDNPELAARIVLMTGGIVMPRIERLLESIPNLVVTKPFDFASLRDFIWSRAVA